MNNCKRVLYIDGAGPFGGASRSLFEAVRRMKDAGFVAPYFLTTKGSSNDYYKKVAEDIISTLGLTRFDNTEYSHYRGLRWLVLLRELWHLPFMLSSLFRAKWRWKKFDLIHVNEITELIPGLLAKFLFRCPLVVHVRSVQSKKNNLRTKWITKLLKRTDGVICIDETVSRSVDVNNKVVVHNSFTVDSDKLDSDFEGKISAYRNFFRVGFVGNFQELKGIADLVEASVYLKDHPDIKFLIVGDETEKKKLFRRLAERVLGLSQDAKTRIISRVEEAKVGDNVIFFGKTWDISSAYKNFDVLCFPSHLDAPGRPVFEAAFFKVPSIVCVRNPTPDTLVPDVTGVIIPEKDPRALADSVLFLSKNADRVKEMGAAASELALQNFDSKRNSEKLVLFYNSVRHGA
ncbi:glycosyltransferase family 4 protein [Achromobacter denitrificans]|uniref:glycosyltransferase family 4 protein n=1 Tax=Achromobacter denitrificans TaxID=32002 RepID=UPI0023E78D25|nr:glycosyltransferase family 4 protein [Achromobacter denitrificans]MDF3846640.1 glycosyltransferase family 4 protein [Achromobacter denitrificans]MDF3856917.1 glycosyltransferase family 4 protein [Achromobacter denitrificans]